MSITFLKKKESLILRYVPEHVNEGWLVEPLQTENQIAISSRNFRVRNDIYLPNFEDEDFAMDACYHFTIGKLENGYYKIDPEVLGIGFDLYLHKSLKFKRSTFVAERNISIFSRFDEFNLKEVFIGGDHPSALPQEEFELLLKQFPNSTEHKRYASARISGILRNYLPIEEDFEAKYQRYLNKKPSLKGSQPSEYLRAYEADKYSDLVDKIAKMLKQEDCYTEDQWQSEILQIILLLYPRYIKAFTEAPVKDSLADKKRRIDFLLVDAAGYIDAIEIKKPFSNCIVTSNRYRDNHVPMKELSGSIMQMEKYLYHLNRWGEKGEKTLNGKYAAKLPGDLTIKIVNPSGLIIMGRDDQLTEDQKNDFEIIRRKYRNVLDIITYDDLLRRLIVIRDHFKANQNAATSPVHP